MNTSVVDKLPSLRSEAFGKDKGNGNGGGSRSDRENWSMTTDKAKKSEDEISYILENKSTIDEEESNDNNKTETASRTTSYPLDTDIMSMSDASSANFSFNTHGENGDAYPALYNPEVQAQYEKMKIEEEEKKERENVLGAVDTIVKFLYKGMSKMLLYLESLCIDSPTQQGKK